MNDSSHGSPRVVGRASRRCAGPGRSTTTRGAAISAAAAARPCGGNTTPARNSYWCSTGDPGGLMPAAVCRSTHSSSRRHRPARADPQAPQGNADNPTATRPPTSSRFRTRTTRNRVCRSHAACYRDLSGCDASPTQTGVAPSSAGVCGLRPQRQTPSHDQDERAAFNPCGLCPVWFPAVPTGDLPSPRSRCGASGRVFTSHGGGVIDWLRGPGSSPGPRVVLSAWMRIRSCSSRSGTRAPRLTRSNRQSPSAVGARSLRPV
jgi:hypothetical protein